MLHVARAGARALAFAVGLVVAGPLLAQAYPAKPLRLIIPFPPGGSSDVIGRLLAQKIGDDLGQQVVAENRPGASGNIGHELAAKAAPDGYTIVLSNSSTLATNPFLFAKMPFDPQKDLVQVSQVAYAPQVLVVHPSVPANTVQELIALARAKPGGYNFGSGGKGIQSHMSGELFKLATKVDIVHVPYKGTIQAVNDLVGGQLQMVFSDMVPAMPHIKAGKLRALAVTTGQRVPQLPNVPTVVEVGVPDATAEVWWSLAVPRGTPPEIVARLNAATVKALAQADVKEKMTDLGVVPVSSTPEAVNELIRRDSAKWSRVVREIGLQPE